MALGSGKMPLTATGRRVLEEMRDRYGDNKGERIFYSTINSGKKGSSKWHESKKSSGSHMKQGKTAWTPRGGRKS